MSAEVQLDPLAEFLAWWKRQLDRDDKERRGPALTALPSGDMEAFLNHSAPHWPPGWPSTMNGGEKLGNRAGFAPVEQSLAPATEWPTGATADGWPPDAEVPV